MKLSIDALSHIAQSIDRARKSELCSTESVHEITASHMPAFFHDFEDRIHRRKTADSSLGEHSLARDDTMALEKLLRIRHR